MTFLYKNVVWEQESKHFAPGWEADHFGEATESFRKNRVVSLERQAGAGCSRQEQRLCILCKEGAIEGVPGREGISRTVF